MSTSRYCQLQRTGFVWILSSLFLLFVQHAQAQSERKIRKLLESSAVLQEHFTGFALFDPDKGKMVYSQYADKYFTPASNTKLFTFYTALKLLGDSIPALRYVVRGDSLIFWGTGDPAFLHESLKANKTLSFLRNAPQQLYYSPANYTGHFYGAGWPYGDYNDDYQADISVLPIAGNVVRFYADGHGGLQASPAYFGRFLQPDYQAVNGPFQIKRRLEANVFVYPGGAVPAGFSQTVPVKTSLDLTVALLEDTLKRAVRVVDELMPGNAFTLYSCPADSVYKAMLLPSDNFIAEQLLLVCASVLGSQLSTEAAINYSKQHFLADLPQEPQWADGSGLSRYNLFTPATMVELLKKIRTVLGSQDRLENLFPAGGKTGTLRTAYTTDQGVPFVWAKTGSLSNNHNQSGYLITRKGKFFIFSFMNNQFVRPTSEVRAEMVRIITEIHERF